MEQNWAFVGCLRRNRDQAGKQTVSNAENYPNYGPIKK